MLSLPSQPVLPPGPPPGTAQRVHTLAAQARSGDARAQAELTDACQQVESQFLRWLLKEMRATVPKSGLLDASPGRDTYEELLDDALADAVARGGGFGLAQALEAQLTRRQATAAEDPAGAAAAPTTRPARRP